MYNGAYYSDRNDTNSVPPYPFRSDHPFATPPQFQQPENRDKFTVPTQNPNPNPLPYRPHPTEDPTSPPWRIVVSPPSTDLEQGLQNHRQDTSLLSNPRHARVCSKPRSRLQVFV